MSPERSRDRGQARPGSVHVEHLWKRFRADRAPRSLRDHLPRRWHRPRSANDDAAITTTTRPSTARPYRFVLRDINLDLAPGDAVGLIGANGSGKSTLLKILAGVMYPYAGSFAVGGRVGALLEVRAGLHGDLSGRENIFLYGGLLGMSRAEVGRRFDDIVEFAVLEEAIDRQVKFYSSGMGLRLGFSVAAFLEPHVLLVDEALSVGDAFFQQRCLDRMRELLQQGTSLVLVSHDLAAVESVCTRGVWLKDGVVMHDGDVRGALGQYRTWLDDAYHHWIDETSGEAVFREGAIDILKAEVASAQGGRPRSQEEMLVDLVLDSPRDIDGLVCVGVTEGTASPVFIMSEEIDLREGHNSISCRIPYLPIAAGRYYLWVEFDGDDGQTRLPWQPSGGPFTVEGKALSRTPIGVMRASSVEVEATWHLHRSVGSEGVL